MLAACTLASTTSATRAQDAAAQANNPLANARALNLQNYYIGELTGDGDKDANQFILRFAAPFSIGEGNWLMRLSVPVDTLPVGGNMGDVTGLGDIDVFAAYLFDTGNPAVSFGIGPEIVAPSAGDDRLGNEQWQLGFANVYFNAASSKFQYGYLLTYRNGVGDRNGRETVQLGAFQPFGFYQLGDGWYTGGAPAWAYDFKSGNYNVPLGLRLGKVIQSGGTVFNLFAEPQYSIAHDGDGQAQWQVFFAMNMQF
ncbi:hypothetical protein [Poseidonocella sp. HB161398]|uniref:hypothetical protein n=1 Tax=Poseidonocella sp. HB161398 TaxID=2320855 RepID=UPI001109B699|nr:hypothetical protein [Poseidonocella sp. HB161398]